VNEIQFIGPQSLTTYFTVRNLIDQIWNTHTLAFETPVNINQHYYAVSLVEQGVGTGYYTGNFPSTIPVANTYNITIFQQLGGSPAVSDTSIGAGPYFWSGSGNGGDYITLAVLKTYLRITVTTYDTLLAQLITQASAALDQALQRTITLAFYYEVLDGTGYSFLKTTNYPIQNISTIIQNYQQNNPITFAGDEFVYNQQGTIRWSEPSTRAGFIQGFQNYLVSYSAGFNPCPQDLQLAACMYCQFLYYYSQKDPTITNKHAKDVSVDYGRALMGDFSSNLFAPIQAILERYKQIDTL
jgi:hypothetical protein